MSRKAHVRSVPILPDRRRGVPDRQRGAVAVEFGLILPVLLLLVFGAIESGWALFTYNTLSHAAQEATRYAIVRGGSSTSPASEGDIKKYLQERAPKLDIPVDQITVNFVPDNSPGNEVQISITYPYVPLIPGLPFDLFDLTTQSRMVIAQ